jgi:phosphoribosylaminoimidazolecarboxamide formyltransferase/IMP cyclohydrolase
MNQQSVTIKRALISVSDKTGVLEFAKALHELKVEIISTGGTSKLLREASIPVRDVAEITDFPEIMDGRVKTLHPSVHGGILGLRDEHETEARKHDIEWIDLVVVNLYPFAETIKQPLATFEQAVENIDIGGPSMIRGGAKNMGWVTVVIDPSDYDTVISELRDESGISFVTRQAFAMKAFAHTAQYDTRINTYFQKTLQKDLFHSQITLNLEKQADLRYGENPHQAASAYYFSNATGGILTGEQHQGKQLSYNNIADADAALACLREFSEPACVVVKHANPCGVATNEKIGMAFERAFQADSVSSFGGIIAMNRVVDKAIAESIWQVFVEVIVAPSYTPEALAILATKPNLRVLELEPETGLSGREFKFINGGLLVQETDMDVLTAKDLEVVTKVQPKPEDIEAMLFAWRVLKHIKSNAILIAKKDVTVGVGGGQVSRIDAVEIALRKAAGNLADTVLASDAFFPFRDSIDRIVNTGIRAVIQPGGSVKDAEVIQACNENGLAMVFTGRRCFKH